MTYESIVNELADIDLHISCMDNVLREVLFAEQHGHKCAYDATRNEACAYLENANMMFFDLAEKASAVLHISEFHLRMEGCALADKRKEDFKSRPTVYHFNKIEAIERDWFEYEDMPDYTLDMHVSPIESEVDRLEAVYA